MPLLTTLRNKLSGLTDSMAFSNRWTIFLQRIMRPADPLVSYCWKKKWWLVCDARFQDGHAAKELLANGCYDAWIRKSVRGQELSYVNVGANIGAFDVAVAAMIREIPLAVSVELNPRTFGRLRFNLQVNGLHDVRVLNAGVAGRSGVFHFHPTACSLADGLFVPPPSGEAASRPTQVPLLTLGETLVQAGVENKEFDLLKLDCEAAEYGIVAESSRGCLRCFRHIVAELHPEPPGESVAALEAKLAECGFQSADPQETAGTALRFWSRA